MVTVARSTLVESHHNVGANNAFDIHDILGCEKMLTAVYMAAEGATFLFDFAIVGQ